MKARGCAALELVVGGLTRLVPSWRASTCVWDSAKPSAKVAASIQVSAARSNGTRTTALRLRLADCASAAMARDHMELR